jgi:hypothetical protein
MARQDRLQVTISPEMAVALAILAERSGLQTSTQAMVLLRQALDRTIGSAECQERLRVRKSNRSVQQWREDMAAERFVTTRRQAAGFVADVREQRGLPAE